MAPRQVFHGGLMEATDFHYDSKRGPTTNLIVRITERSIEGPSILTETENTLFGKSVCAKTLNPGYHFFFFSWNLEDSGTDCEQLKVSDSFGFPT